MGARTTKEMVRKTRSGAFSLRKLRAEERGGDNQPRYCGGETVGIGCAYSTQQTRKKAGATEIQNAHRAMGLHGEKSEIGWRHGTPSRPAPRPQPPVMSQLNVLKGTNEKPHNAYTWLKR